MLSIGERFRQEQYVVLKEFSDSEFVATYLAYMPFAERYVTLVVLKQSYRAENSAQLFHRAASITASIDHPNVARVFESGEERGLHFYAQEHHLASLQGYLDYVGDQDTDALHLLPKVLQVCEVVGYCQAKSIVHGHLAPDEIYLADDRQVLISSFCYQLGDSDQRGIVELLPWARSSYHPPEITEQGSLSFNSDIFSIGALAYRILVGNWSNWKAASKTALESSTLAASLPRHLSDLVWDALAPEPTRRLQSISPLIELLEGILSQPILDSLVDDAILRQWCESLVRPDAGKMDLITQVDRLWQQGLANISNEGALHPVLQSITTAFSDALWARGFKPEVLRFDDLYYGMVDQPLVKIRIPSSFPVVFIPFRKVTQRRVEAIQDLVRNLLPPAEYFAILLPFFHSEQLVRLARESAYDFVLLDEDGLKEIIAAKNSPSQFVQTILLQMDLVSLSPYVIRGPVPRNMFFGRGREIKTIVQRIEDTSITVVGGRKIGKTSILQRVEQILSEEEKWNVVYCDCQSVRDYDDFFSVLRFEVKASLAGRQPKDFLGYLEYVQNRNSDRSTVLLLDEVDTLLDFDQRNGETLSRLFRSLSQTNQCRFIFCGERALHSIQSDPYSPFFNFCHTLSLRYLDREATFQLVFEPMRNLGLTLHPADETAEQIFLMSNGHPNIIQFICHRLVESIAQAKRRVIGLSDLAAIQSSVDFPEYFLEVVWGTATPLEKLISLHAISEEFTSNDIIHTLKAEGVKLTHDQAAEALDHLVLYGIFARRGARHYTLTAESLQDVVRQHIGVETMRYSLCKETTRWLKQYSNHRDH
jgi:serine/threonine protein kinase